MVNSVLHVGHSTAAREGLRLADLLPSPQQNMPTDDRTDDCALRRDDVARPRPKFRKLRFQMIANKSNSDGEDKGRIRANVVVVETPAYDLTVFRVRYGKLTLKIDTSFIMPKWNPHVVALGAFRPQRARPINSSQMA
jgi:hypothetical protein